MDTITTSAEVTQATDNWYSPVLLTRAVSNFIFTRFGQVRDIPEGNGMVIKFRRYGNLTAATTALTEGVTPAGSALSITDVTATVLQYGDYVTLSDVLQFSTLDPLLVETANVLGDQAGETLDTLCRNVLVAGTTIQYASTASQVSDITASMVVNATEVKEAVLTLRTNHAKMITEMIDPMDAFNTIPVGRAFIGIIHPKVLRDLEGDTNFIPVQKYPSQAKVMEDEVGALGNVRFLLSENSYEVAEGSSSAKVYKSPIFGKDFYGITRISGQALKNIIKPLGSAGTSDALDQRSTSGWKATFITKILNNAFGVILVSGATQ